MPPEIAVTPDQPEVAARQLGPKACGPNSTDVSGPRIQAAARPRLTLARLSTRLAAIEWAIVVVSAIVAKLIYIDGHLGGAQQTLPFALLGLILGFILHLFYNELDLYERRAMRGSSVAFGKLIGGLVLSFLVLVGFLYLLKIGELFSRGWMLLWFGMSACMLCSARGAMSNYVRYMVAKGRIQERIGIVGAINFVRQLRKSFESCSEVVVAGVYSDHCSSRGLRPNSTPHQGLEGFIADARKGAFDQIIIAIPAAERKRTVKVVERLAVLPLDLHLYASPLAFPVTIHGSRNIGHIQVHLVMPKPPSVREKIAKTVFDYLLAASLLVVFLPLFVVIALAIKADSRGPVLFRQQRYGQNQKVFSIYKFRTMNVTEDGPIIKQAERNDCRTTRIGRILRRTSLDELPQLINVLRGEMAIVGPRPHALVHDERYALELSHYLWRHRVKAGITGWAQIHGLRGETRTCEAMQKRMDYDLYYIDNWSIWLDLEILFRTPFAMLMARGAY